MSEKALELVMQNLLQDRLPPSPPETPRLPSTEGYLANGESIFIPEVCFTSIPEGCHTEELRGYRYVLAVMQGNRCLGWADRVDLGLYASSR